MALGLAVSLVEGRVHLVLEEYTPAPGLEVRGLELDVPGVEFPVDLSGGSARLQHRATRLRRLVLRVGLAELAAHLARAAEEQPAIEHLALRAHRGALLIEATLVSGTARAMELLFCALVPGLERELHLVTGEQLRIGAVALPDDVVLRALAAAISRLGAALPRPPSPVLRGAELRLDPLPALLWSIFPPHGWKLPDDTRIRLSALDVTKDAVELRWDAHGPPAAETSSEPLRLLARADAKNTGSRTDATDPVARFEALRAALDPAATPLAALEPLLLLAQCDPRLFADGADLAQDAAALHPAAAAPHLTLAAIAEAEGLQDEAHRRYLAAAERLGAAGHARARAFALLAAARLAPADELSLLDAAAPVLGDDPVFLRAALDAHLRAENPRAALAAARRLSRVSSASGQVFAHRTAGELLLRLEEPIAAKRELERALALAPDDLATLEALARALQAHGDRRRAAVILERLLDRAVEAGALERAAGISLSLGDLWRSVDREAAELRYRRALELDPHQARAALELATLADAPPAKQAALARVEQVLERAHRDEHPLAPGDRLALHLHAGRLASLLPDRIRDAIEHLRRATALAPSDPEPLDALNELLRREGRGDPALLARSSELWRAKGDLRRATRAALEEARLLHRSGQSLDGVRRQLETVVSLDPGQRDAVEALIELAELGGSSRALVEAISRRLSLDAPQQLQAELLAKRGEALARLGDVASAVADLRAALERSPADVRALSGLLALLRGSGDGPRLAELLLDAAERATGLTRTTLLAQRARVLAEAGAQPEAYAAARQVLEHEPLPELLPLATRLALELGDLDGARSFLHQREALAEPTDEDRLRLDLDLAELAARKGDLDGRVEALSRALDRAEEAGAPPPDEAFAALASVLREAGRLGPLGALELRRARWPGTSPQEAARLGLAAARAFERAGDPVAASEAALLAVQSAAQAAGCERWLEEALELGEQLATRTGDARAIASWIARRAAHAPLAQRAGLVLREAEVLCAGGLEERAAERLEQALVELPRALAIAERLAEVARGLGRTLLAGKALARAAQLLEARGDLATALVLHQRAAGALVEAGAAELALPHDRVVVERSADPRETSVLEALRRLERHARTTGDAPLLCQVLDRWSKIEPPEEGVHRLIEKARLEAERLHQPEAALVTLRRARTLPAERPRPELDLQIEGLLTQLGRFEELAALLEARAARQADAAASAALLVRAAEVFETRLDNRPAALIRARAAVRADPSHVEARELRRRLLFELDSIPELAEALLDDARASSGEDRLRLSLEALEVLAPIAPASEDAPAATQPAALARALEVAREIARSEPRLPAAHRRVAAYARLLSRVEEEFLALGRLIEHTTDPVERTVSQLRRTDLLRGPLEDPVGAQGELVAVITAIDEMDAAARDRLEEHAIRAAHLTLEPDSRGILASVLRLGARITAQSGDWQAHLNHLGRLLELTEGPHARADLHFRMGEITEWKLGDGAAAERQYLAALAIDRNHRQSTEALSSSYLAVDRFGDLAENLGIERLERSWRELRSGAPPQRVIAAGEALWPRLPPGSRERGEVLLALADLYRSARDEAEGAVMLLDLVVREGPPELEPAALERLRVLFLEEERFDLYVEILRRQAERLDSDSARARALVELGEALEWKLGDGVAAEREYRSALAADPACESARNNLALLLASQDRFSELAADLGREALEKEVEALAARAPRERDRAWRAAEALAERTEPSAQARFWLDLARWLGDDEDRRRALERARDQGGPAALEALAALQALDDLAPPSRGHVDDAPTMISLAALTPADTGDDATHLGPSTPEPVPEAPVAANDALAPVAEAGPPEEHRRWRRRETIIAHLAGSGDLVTEARAAALARHLLLRAPLDRPLLEALAAALVQRGDAAAAAGPAEILRARWRSEVPGAAPLASLPDAPEPGFWRALATEPLSLPLGALLARTAPAAAAVLPPAGSDDRRALAPDAPPADWTRQLARLLEVEVALEADPQLGREALVEAGEPPLIVLGEPLLEAPPDAQRFAIARALMSLRLGRLVLDQPAPGGEPGWIELLLRVSDPDAARVLPEALVPAIEPLRARLGPSALAEAEGLVEQAQDTSPAALMRVRSAAQRAADAFGLLAAGSISPLLAALGGAEDDAVWTATRVLDAARFLVGPGYLRALSALPSAREAARPLVADVGGETTGQGA